MDDLSDFEVIQRFFAPSYLDNPIISTGRSRLVLGFLEAYQLRHARSSAPLTTSLPRHERDFISQVIKLESHSRVVTIQDPETYAIFIRSLPCDSTLSDDSSRKYVAEMMKEVLTGLARHAPSALRLAPRFSHPPTKETTEWYQRWSWMDTVTETIVARMAEGHRLITGEAGYMGTYIVSSQYVCFVNTCHPDDLLLTYDQWLMFKDMAYSRYQVYAAAQWFYPSNADMTVSITAHIRWQEDCLSRYGNEGYEIAKNTEALAKAFLSYRTDTVFAEDGPYLRMVDKVKEKEKKLGASTSFLVDAYDTILRSTQSLETIVELFGLQKMCGHPLIDPARGGLSAAAEARAVDHTLYSDACRLRNNFCRIYLQAYVSRHGSWPPLLFEDKARTTLRRLSNIQYRALRVNSYPLEDWNTCRFLKHQEFDYHPNFLDLMDDKSISFYRSEKHATWDRSVKPRSHRRLLVEMLSRPHISPKEIVDKVMKRDIPLDWYIVSLYPKEREFKLAARMFSMLVFEIRLYFALTEANLASAIYPYLPQQTMTKDKISVLRTFGDLTRPVLSGSRLRYYLEVDLSRWNLRWRSLSVHLVGDVLDDIFGLRGVFTFVHEFFSESLILVRVADIRPPQIEHMSPPETDTVWYNHHGGFEGITQKLWTICTYSMVDLGLQQFPVHYVLIGQGDNQVVAVTLERDPAIPLSTQCKESRTAIMSVLEQECSKTNQEMKPEECLESTTVLTYSKDVYIHGVDYHTTLKAHSRLFPHSSTDFPSVASNVGAIFSTSLAGAERTRLPLISYALGHLHAFSYLSRTIEGRGIYGKRLQLSLRSAKVSTSEYIQFFLALPSELGGFAIPTAASFLYKGGADPLSNAVAGVRLRARGAARGSIIHRILRSIQDRTFLNPTPRLSALIKDPYGLPIQKPSTPADRVSRQTMAAIVPLVKNEDLREIMSTEAQEYSETLISTLTDIRPLNPLIAHDLLDCSIYGLVHTLSTMFTATRSIQTLARSTGSPIVERLLSQEHAGLVYLASRLRTSPRANPDLSVSIFSLVTRLREGWCPGASDRTIVGVTSYHPLDFEVVWGANALSTTGISLLMQLDNASISPFTHRGNNDPYLGSKTREKRSEHGYKIVGRDATSAAFRKLQLIMSQVGKDAHLTQLIDDIGLSRSNTLLSPISTLLTTVVGGTVSHRYAAKVGHLAAHLLGSFTFASNCIITSDSAGFLSGGFVDYPVMFQEYFLTLGALAQIEGTCGDPSDTILCTIRIGDSPLIPVTEENFCLPHPPLLSPLRLPHNNLAFLSDIEIVKNTSIFSYPGIDANALRGEIRRTSTYAREVTVSWFRSVLRANNAARMIADSNTTVTGRPLASLDLAETISLGIGRIVDAAGIAIAEEAIYNAWRTARAKGERWRLAPFIRKLSEALSLVVAEHLGHPLLRKDRFCRQHSLTRVPLYQGGSSAVRARLCGVIAARTRHLISHPDSYLYIQNCAVFASEEERSMSEVGYKTLCLALHRAWLQGEISTSEGTTIMSRHLIPLGRNKEDEANRLAELQVLAYVIHDWSTRRERPLLAHSSLALARGDRLRVYPVSVAEVLRDMRNSRLWGLSSPLPAARPHGLILDAPRVVPSRVILTGSPRVLAAGPRSLVVSSVWLEETLTTNFWASRGRTYGLFSTAGYDFVPCISLFKSREVLIVGVGNGGVARLALEAGARHVYGLDLRTTVPMDGHGFQWYKPPMVAMSERDDCYTQLIQSFITAGDWLSPSVSSDVLDSILPSTVIVIDIQSGTRRFGLEVLHPLVMRKWKGAVVVRFFVSQEEVNLLCTDLLAEGSKMRVFFQPRPGSPTGSCLIVLSSLPSSLVTCMKECCAVGSCPTASVDLSLLGGSRLALLAEAVCHTFLPASDLSFDDLLSAVWDTYDDIRGEYVSRPTYTGWTVLLRAVVSAYWLTVSDVERLRMLEQCARSEKLTVRKGETILQVEGSPTLGRHLAKVVARLLAA